MFKRAYSSILTFMLLSSLSSASNGVYLNDQNITVSLGSSMAAEPFANRTAAASLASIIDAPSATADEFHNQSTHVWVSGGVLELDFDFGVEYDLQIFHFWNYHTESHDVDDIDMSFFDSAMNLVGTINDIMPALGNLTGRDADPIIVEDRSLSFPVNVQFVNMVLSGSNNQVDFSNIGFTAVVSQIPLPAAVWLFGSGLIGLAGVAKRKQSGL
jgi:hypothetical protein